jgi:hypothetical protein
MCCNFCFTNSFFENFLLLERPTLWIHIFRKNISHRPSFVSVREANSNPNFVYFRFWFSARTKPTNKFCECFWEIISAESPCASNKKCLWEKRFQNRSYSSFNIELNMYFQQNQHFCIFGRFIFEFNTDHDPTNLSNCVNKPSLHLLYKYCMKWSNIQRMTTLQSFTMLTCVLFKLFNDFLKKVNTL